MIEFAEIQVFVVVLMALFAAIIIVDKIIDIVKKYREPGIALEEEIKTIKNHLDNDNERINKLEESSKLTLQGINALIEFNITDDERHKIKLIKAKDAINNWLISRS